MRIEGFVPTKNDIPVWGFLAPTEQDVKEILFKLLPEDSEWGEWEEEGWKIVRVGDVDSIRDEALEEAAKEMEKEVDCVNGCPMSPDLEEWNCDDCDAERIRAMKAKP